MKSLRYIWRNVTRNKIRSTLTILSVAFSLALMTILYGYIAMQDLWGREAVKHHRLVVMNSQGFSGAVPIAYVDRVKAMQGVEAAVPYSWFGGNFEEEQMPFAQFGTDPKEVFRVWNEYTIDPEQLRNWQTDRQGCIVDRRLAEKRRWAIGDRIRLRGTFFPVNLDLKLVGTFDAPQNTDSLMFDLTYLEESLRSISNPAAGNAGTIFAKVSSPDLMPTLSASIDEKFGSSENPTRTQTEAAFAQMFTDMVGNIRDKIRNIGLAIVFTLSLVSANAMAMSIRERTTEIAVLKAIGFSKLRVLWMVLGESCAISVIGGMFGLCFGCLCLQGLHGLSPQLFPFGFSEMAGPWMLILLAIAATIGLISGIFPAVRASRLSVIDGLRRVV